MSDSKKEPPKAEELGEKDLEKVDGGIAIIANTAGKSIGTDQLQVDKGSVEIDQNLNIDPLSINIQRG